MTGQLAGRIPALAGNQPGMEAVIWPNFKWPARLASWPPSGLCAPPRRIASRETVGERSQTCASVRKTRLTDGLLRREPAGDLHNREERVGVVGPDWLAFSEEPIDNGAHDQSSNEELREVGNVGHRVE